MAGMLKETRIYVGTSAFGDAVVPRTILCLSLSHADGKLKQDWVVEGTQGENPGWLVPFTAANGQHFVAVGYEVAAGAVQMYRVAHRTLEPLGKPVSSVGRHPCYLARSEYGNHMLVANYSEGSVAVLPILADGSLGAATDSKHHQGGDLIDASLHDRQEGSHCHCIIQNPKCGDWVAVCDLGLSTVFTYNFDPVRGSLCGAHDDPRHLRMPAESGCRHACWSSDGKWLFVNNELDCSLTAASFDFSSGALEEVVTVPTLPKGIGGLRAHHRGNSDIHIYKDKFIYIGCRSPDPGVIAVFAIDWVDSKPSFTLVQHESTRGLVPRNFKLIDIDSSNNVFLVLGNQETRNVVSYSIDIDTGKLRICDEISVAPFKPCNIAVGA